MRALLLFILVNLFLKAESQLDTVVPPQKRAISFVDNNEYIVSNKVFPIHQKFISDFLGVVISSGKEFREGYNNNRNTYYFDNYLTVRNCGIYEPSEELGLLMENPLEQYIFNEDVTLTKINYRGKNNKSPFHILDSEFRQTLSFDSSYIGTLQMDDVGGYLYFQSDTLERMMVSRLKKEPGSSLDLQQIHFIGDDSWIEVSESLVGSFSLSSSKFNRLNLLFRNDTIHDRFTIDRSDKLKSDPSYKYKMAAKITFKDCYINSPFLLNSFAEVQHLIFENCQFGPLASLSNLTVDTLQFLHCAKLPATLHISTISNNTDSYLQIENTDLSDSKLIYNEGLHLLFPGTTDLDMITTTYESLLGKFKEEGKFESYKRLDIEYRNYKASQAGIFSKAGHWLNKVWWNYGYSKQYIVGWTIFFLLSFFVMNIIWWEAILSVYPFETVPANERNNKGLKLYVRKYSIIFLYTSLVFFSLKVDLDELKFNSTRMVAFFFLQYIVGLICMFFIFNALIKI